MSFKVDIRGPANPPVECPGVPRAPKICIECIFVCVFFLAILQFFSSLPWKIVYQGVQRPPTISGGTGTLWYTGLLILRAACFCVYFFRSILERRVIFSSPLWKILYIPPGARHLLSLCLTHTLSHTLSHSLALSRAVTVNGGPFWTDSWHH